MSNGQRNIKQKSTILAIILVIYIYVPYFANILENTFKISSLYEYNLYDACDNSNRNDNEHE